MTVQERSVGEVLILDLEGRITVQDGASTFRDALQRVANQDRLDLLLNMQLVPYIDSTALGELVRAYASALRRGGTLKLLKPTTRVHQLLTVTRLFSVLDSFDDEEVAIKSFVAKT